MFCRLKILLLPICMLLTAVASAQEKKIPQVLFLGDPVQQAIVQAAAKELTGKANFHYPPPGSANDSGTALARIDQLLGDKPWDIIYFNFGIGDLFYKDPASKEIRIMNKDAGGVRVSTPSQYEKNLEAIVKRLTASKAKLIWGSTTPLNNGNLFDGDSEKEYNAIAARVMASHKVPVLDLHAYAMAQFKPGDKQPPHDKYAAEMQKRGRSLHTPLVNAFLSTSKVAK
jgi:acyl-CoA thioesterase-1